MDIRMINSKGEIINVTNLSIKRTGKWLVGINENGYVTQIEEYESEEEAEDVLKRIGECITDSTRHEHGAIIVQT